MTTENKAVLTRDRGPDYLQRNIRMTQDQIDPSPCAWCWQPITRRACGNPGG